MTEGELLMALLPVISMIDGGCEACVGSFVLNANEALEKGESEFRLLHVQNWESGKHVSVVLKSYFQET